MEVKHGMKANTIRQVLRKKLVSLVDTIEDKAVADLVNRDAIITGGSIASMLLGETINDYDIYFRTKETTLAVANYYAKVFNDANDLQKKDYVHRSCKPVVKEDTITNIKGEAENRVIFWMQSAGVASETQETYAYFESRPEHETTDFADSVTRALEDLPKEGQELELAEELAEELKPTKKKYRPVYFSQNAVTLSDKVQLIVRFFGEPEEIHRSFDYVHATCWYEYGNDKLVLPPEAMECLLSRTLKYRGSLYPLASVFRIRKFIERGWRITAGEVLKILWQVSELDLNDRAVLQEQLIGVDQAYMWQLVSALKDVKGNVDATYLAQIIDGVFG